MKELEVLAALRHRQDFNQIRLQVVQVFVHLWNQPENQSTATDKDLCRSSLREMQY